MISLIIDWSNVPGVIDSVSKVEINTLINFVAENCYSENASITRTNLELFSSLLSRWTSKINIPYKPIFDNLQDIDKHIRNCCGLKMLAAVLANEYPFMDGAHNSVKSGFIKQLVKNLRSKIKSVYGPAFELCGILLKKISSESESNCDWVTEMSENIKSALEFVLSRNESDFVTCLSLIGKNCIEFISPQMHNLISILKSLPDDDLCKALELLGCGPRNSEEWSLFFKQLFHINIFEYIQFKSSSVICSLMQIMHQTIVNIIDWKNSPEIKTSILKCFDNCLPCCTHEEKNVRAIFYQLFIDLCTGEDLLFENSFRSALLMGLIDSDKEIAQSIRNFCSSFKYLPTGTLDRSHTILEILFPETHLKSLNDGFLNRSKFLAIATNIILEMTSHSPDFIKPLFQNQLDINVVFENLTAARMNSQTSRSLLPNFVNTAPYINSSFTSHDQSFRIPTSMNIPKKAKNFDWIKLASTLQFHNQDFNGNKSEDNYSMEWSSSQIPGVEMSLSLKSQKSFLISKSTIDVKPATEQNRDNQEINNRNLIIPTGNESFSTQEEVSEYFRSKTIQKRKSMAKKLKIERNIKTSSVFLYRNYQTGKLPDIQIPNSSIIAPIQMLAQLDDEFSKELFINLFNSLIKESESIVDSDVFKGFCNKLSKCFNNILDTCTITDKNVISSCLEIAIENSSHIQLNPSYVHKACSLSGNEVLATILLEKYLTLFYNSLPSLSDDVPPVKKIKLTESTSVVYIVSFLMKLYKFLNLNEEIIGLLHIENVSTNSNLVDSFRMALEADYCGNYSLSYELYNSLLTKRSRNENEDDFEYEMLLVSQSGLIHSLKKLCKWGELSTFLNGVIEETQNFKVYKSMILSKLRNSIYGVDHECNEVEKLDELVNRFQTKFSNYELLIPMEMSLYEIVKDNYHEAEKFCNIAYDKILAECRDYSLSGETDPKILYSLHLLHEMSDFLQTVDKNNQINFLEIWKERNPDLVKDSLEFWENLLFHRTVYMNKWKVKLPLFSERIDNYLHDLQMQFIDVCINQNRFTPALNYLKSCKQKSYQIDSNSKLNWCLKYCKIHLKSASCHGNVVSRDSVQEIIPKIVNSIKLLTKLSNITDASFSLTWQYYLNLGDCYWSISNISRYHWSFLIDKISVVDSIFQLVGLVNNGFESVLFENLSKKALDFLEKVIPLYYETKCDEEKQQLSSALMVLSDFCDAQIVIYQNVESEKTIQNCSGIINNYVESTLLSMKLGEFSAKNKFPRLLQIISEYGLQNIDLNHVKNIFHSIPSWMFISWLDQMMSYLDSGNNCIVESIIQRISIDYPHSLFYPFMLHVTNVVKKSNFIIKIEKTLSSLTILHQFYAALPLMGQPEDHIRIWLEEASEMFSTTDHNESIRQNIVDKYKAMYQKFIGDFKGAELESGYSHRKSQFHHEFSKWFRANIVEKFQDDGTCIYSLTQNQFSCIQRKIHQELNVWKSRMVDFKKLSEFSPLLAKYNIRDFTRESRNNLDWLEVPGQYNNITSRPFPEKHIKIFKFDQFVQIIPSKQNPKKIKIIGDNEQHYSFLVKSGEDLRQDFRIEQMFSVMNDIISRDHQLKRNLKSQIFIVTYNVIPISNSLGLLEWIDNTVTLRDFYLKTIKNDEQDTYKKIFDEYYSQFPSNVSYIKSWEKPDVFNTNRIFEEYQNITSKFDLLRKSIIVISKNQESFYRMRIKFIQQYAMTAAAHYVLGIGDRHLKNFLIDENTGNIIGIDFGYAFGMASVFLPIPELIPFRLTSSITQFLKPSGVEGIFSQILDSVLATLSRDQLTIMSIMHVFLTNQIIDWHRMSRMNKQSIESFTQKRIDISHRKLKREDPLLLLYEEIEIKHGKSNWFKCLKSFQIKSEEISQAKQLISMATNIGFLSRTWKGLEPLL